MPHDTHESAKPSNVPNSLNSLLASETKQVWSLLRSWKAFKLWLFVFKSKQFEKMQISFVCFLRTRKILITFLRQCVSRHDERTVQKTLQTRMVEATQFCCDWFDLAKELWEIQIWIWRLCHCRM